MPPKVLQDAKVDKEAESTTEILMHPLVVMNVSDHHVRTKIANGGNPTRVAGALFGQQQGRRLEVHTTFEIKFDIGADGKINVDLGYLKQKRDQYTEVFPKYEVLGWYITGTKVLACDLETHKDVMTLNESPLLLVVDCDPEATARTLGAYLYETTVQVADGHVKHGLNKVSYSIESEESERIGVENVSRLDTGSTATSALVAPASTFAHAVGMLQGRVGVLLQYLKDVKDKKMKPDHELLRRISSLCHKLPCASTEAFQRTFGAECEDSALITYLAMLSKGCVALADLVDKSNLSQERRRQFFF